MKEKIELLNQAIDKFTLPKKLGNYPEEWNKVQKKLSDIYFLVKYFIIVIDKLDDKPNAQINFIIAAFNKNTLEILDDLKSRFKETKNYQYQEIMKDITRGYISSIKN